MAGKFICIYKGNLKSFYLMLLLSMEFCKHKESSGLEFVDVGTWYCVGGYCFLII